jgi:secondary thiamine-phosphate synthase enzyme
MSRRSTVTVRERPVSDVITAAGTFKVHGETIAQSTNARIEIFDLTDRVTTLVRNLHMKEGLVSIFSMHTTCTVFINEFQQALLADMKTFLEKIVSADAGWLHNDPAHSDCDRGNADAHLRSMLLGHSLTLQINGGEVVLGQWQRILMAELDGPRARTLRVQVMGVA